MSQSSSGYIARLVILRGSYEIMLETSKNAARELYRLEFNHGSLKGVKRSRISRCFLGEDLIECGRVILNGI